MPEPLNLDEIEKRWVDVAPEDKRGWTPILRDIMSLIARVLELEKDAELDDLNAEEFETALIKKNERVRDLEKQVDHCIHDAVDEQERFKALLDAVREDDLGGRATAQAIVNLEVEDD